ncbi:hypothetical protein GCM10027284_24480 [Cyclobacterium sediminis]
MYLAKKFNFLQRTSIRIPTLVLLGLIVSIISGCDMDDNEDLQPLPDISYVGLYHASPDTPPLDVNMENGRINYYPLRYSEYTDYLNFYAGERTMRVNPFNASNVVLDTTFNFEPNLAYSLFYVDEYADIKALLIEDNPESLADGESAVRFIHLSPDSPQVDLVRMEDEENTILVEDSEYLNTTPFTVVDSGVQSFTVNSSDSDEELLSLPDLNLRSGGVYTFVVRGYSNPPSGNQHNLSADVLINN